MAAAAIAFYTVKDASLGSATSVFAVSVLLLPSSPLLDYADAVNLDSTCVEHALCFCNVQNQMHFTSLPRPLFETKAKQRSNYRHIVKNTNTFPSKQHAHLSFCTQRRSTAAFAGSSDRRFARTGRTRAANGTCNYGSLNP